MEPDLRRQVTWVALIAIVASLIVFASYRRNELNMLRDEIGTGRPDQQVAAVKTLIAEEKLGDALQDQQPRWVQDNVVEAVARIGTPDALFQLAGVIYLLDDPVAARAKATLERFDTIAIGPCVKALKDKDANVRAGANDPLVAIGPAVVPSLVPLMDAWDQYVRDGVVAVFGAIGAPVADTCIKVIEQTKPGPDETPQRFLWKRDTANRSLIAMKAAAISPIIKKLFVSKDKDVRALAAQTLGTIADQTIVPTNVTAAQAQKCVGPLLNLLNNDPAWLVRTRAATALGGIGKLPGVSVVPALIAHLSEGHSEIRAAAAEALGRIGNPVAAEPLVHTLETARTGAVNQIVIALEKIGPPALQATIPALSSPESDIREAATEAVSVIGTSNAVVPLANMLKDPDVAIRRRASDALVSLADSRVVPQLIAGLSDPDWHVYYSARDALAQVGPPAIPGLVSALGSHNARVAHMAEQALSRIGKPSVPALVSDLATQDPVARQWAAVALGDIGDVAVEVLAKSVADMTRPAYVRAAMANALGRTASPGALAPLMAAAKQPEPEVRIAAENALVRLEMPDATATLVAGLTDKSQAVRATAMKLLMNWRLGDLTKLLDQTIANGDQDTQRRGAIVLAYQQAATMHELVNATILGLNKKAKSSVDVAGILKAAVSDAQEKPEVRMYAVRSLGYVGDASALSVLSKLLRPTDPLAPDAARSIALIGRRINENEFKATQEIIVRRHPPTQAGKELIDLMTTTDNPGLRMDAAVALSLMSDDPVFGLIDKFAEVKTDQQRLWIAATLGAIGKPASDACLDERSSSSHTGLAKQWITLSLELVGDAQANNLIKHLPKAEQPDPAQVAAGEKILEQIRAARAGTA